MNKLIVILTIVLLLIFSLVSEGKALTGEVASLQQEFGLKFRDIRNLLHISNQEAGRLQEELGSAIVEGSVLSFKNIKNGRYNLVQEKIGGIITKITSLRHKTAESMKGFQEEMGSIIINISNLRYKGAIQEEIGLALRDSYGSKRFEAMLLTPVSLLTTENFSNVEYLSFISGSSPVKDSILGDYIIPLLAVGSVAILFLVMDTLPVVDEKFENILKIRDEKSEFDYWRVKKAA
ncbi:MAG: hypothetical protein ACE5EA_08070 [Nitrospirota bacterium]